jgi:hemin uptake protein HemP
MADEKDAGSSPHVEKAEPREIEVRDLMGDAKEVILLHAGEPYRLRITANGKLILTK